MTKWLGVFLAWIVLSGFLSGCAETSKDLKFRCPKCGAYFSTKEGEEEFRWMRGR